MPFAVLHSSGECSVIAAIDRLVPEYENPHEMTYLEGEENDELTLTAAR